MTSLSPRDGDKYLWYRQGQADEAAARNSGVSQPVRELRDCLEALAQDFGKVTAEDMLVTLTRIYCPHVLKRGYRR